jgi:S-DNA-T family DNA segregation ATPase FtsK/SpoIIIE
MARRGGRRSKANRDIDGVIIVVVVVLLGVALWQRLSWWLVVFAAAPVICWLLAIQWGWLRRHRRKLAPTTAGIAVAVAAYSSKAIAEVGGHGGWVLGVYAALTAAIAWGIRVDESRDHRRYFTVALIAGLAWTAAVHLTDWARWPDMAGTWTVLVILASAFWWTDRRVIHEVKAEERVRSWPEIVRGTELAGTVREYFTEKPEGGWRMRLTWAPGRNLVDAVRKHDRLLESVMDAPRRSVTIEADGANAVIAECSPVGSLGALVWDGQVATSIADTVMQARYGDNTVEAYPRWVPGIGGKHKLRAGKTRSGKSGGMKHDAVVYGPAEDVVLWLIDLKGGASLRALAPMADWFATRTDEAVAMLEAAARLCDARGHYMSEQGWDPWQPSRQHPVIVIMADEVAKLLGYMAPHEVQGRALAAATIIGQQGAGLGILIDPATQFATLEALGSSQFREQLALTECYRMRSEGTAAHFLPNAPSGVEPAQLPASSPGAHYVDVDGEFRPQVAQKPNVTPEQVQAVVAEYWDTTPEIEAVHHPVLGEAWARRDRWVPQPDGKVARVAFDAAGPDAAADVADRDEEDEMPQQHGATPRDEVATVSQRASQPVSQPEYRPAWAGVADDGLTYAAVVAADAVLQTPEQRAAEKARLVTWLAETRPADPAQAPEIVWRLLTEAPDGEPVSPGDAQRASGLSESTVHRLLRRWEDEGRVEHVGRGAYRPVVAGAVTGL